MRNDIDYDTYQELIERIHEFFERHSDDEFLEGGRIKPERLLHPRSDVHAFILLDKLVPSTRDMVSAAEHDEIWLDVEPTKVFEAATEEDLLDLIRCGVRYDDDLDSFCMFV